MDKAMQFISDNYKAIIFVVLGIVLAIIVGRIVKAIRRKIRSIKYRVQAAISPVNNAIKLANKLVDMQNSGELEEVAPKSVGGATSIYIKQINMDFPDYHNPDAEAAVQTFLLEFLDAKYKGVDNFSKSKISDKLRLNIPKEDGSHSNVKFNGIAIYDYTKTRNFATVGYRCSLGYDLNGRRVETRFNVDYTLQLESEHGSSASIKCKVCGAVLNSNKDSECPYCGAEIIKDTLMSWVITEVSEC